MTLNQIPYSGSDEQIQGMTSDRVPKELWMEICTIVQEAVTKTIPKKKKGKMGIWTGITNSWKKKKSEKQRRKGKIHTSECRIPKNSKER